jgi:ubiquinone/menaquinone biosynthesis C-methylase UbiE
MWDIDSIAAHYDSCASSYDDDTPYHTSLANLFVSYAQPKPGDNVLDLACGAGLVTFALLPHVLNEAQELNAGQKVIGIDNSDKMLEQADQKAIKIGMGGMATFVLGASEDLSLIPDMEGMERRFQIITICSSLVHLLMGFLKDIVIHWSTYLAPGGRFVVDVPTPRAMLRTEL